MEIEASLLKPQGYDGKSKLPLIALVHGGPTGRWSESIDTWGQLLATHGYAVFYPNIRGSVGYGQKFVEANRGDWGGGTACTSGSWASSGGDWKLLAIPFRRIPTPSQITKKAVLLHP